MKKVPVWLWVVAAVLLVALGWFLFLRPISAWQAIPKSAVAVVQTNNWVKLDEQLKTTYGGTALKNTYALKKLIDEIQSLQVLFEKDRALNSNLLSENTLVAINLTTADDFDLLFAMPLKSENSGQVLKSIQQSSLFKSVADRVFNNQHVYDITLRGGKQVTLACLKGVMVISYTPFVAENSVTTLLHGGSALDDKGLVKTLKQLPSAGDLNLFINYPQTAVLLPAFIQPDKIAMLKGLSDYSTWGAYAVKLSNEGITLNGVDEMTLNEPLPTISFDKNPVLQNVPDNAVYLQLLSNTNAVINIKAPDMLQSCFADWAGATKAFITLEPLSTTFDEQQVFMLQVTDKTKALAGLKKLLRIDGSNGLPTEHFEGLDIYNLKSGSVINKVFGGNFAQMGNCFFLVKDDVAIFCNSSDHLKLILDKIAKGELLTKTSNFANCVDYKSETGQLIYFSPLQADMLLTGMLQTGSCWISFLQQFNGALAQSRYDKKFVYTQVTLKAGDKQIKQSGKIWQTTLQAPARMAPQILIDAANGDRKIFVQDTLFNIYLLNKGGEVLFTKNVEESVVGPVAQIDYYNNGNHQYIFTTERHIYVLKDDGEPEAGYPIRLSYPTTCGLTVANGRYYVPCKNGAVYAYQISGRPVPGWSPRTGVGLLSSPLIEVNNGNGDLLLLNDDGRLLLLDKKGAAKWSVANLTVAPNNFVVIPYKQNFETLITSDNRLTEISADGNDKMKLLLDTAQCLAATSTSDTTYLYFYANGSKLRSYDQDNKFVTAHSDKSNDIKSLEVISASSEKYLLANYYQLQKHTIYSLALNPLAEFDTPKNGFFAVTDLLVPNQLTVLNCDDQAHIWCYRLK